MREDPKEKLASPDHAGTRTRQAGEVLLRVRTLREEAGRFSEAGESDNARNQIAEALNLLASHFYLDPRPDRSDRRISRFRETSFRQLGRILSNDRYEDDGTARRAIVTEFVFCMGRYWSQAAGNRVEEEARFVNWVEEPLEVFKRPDSTGRSGPAAFPALPFAPSPGADRTPTPSPNFGPELTEDDRSSATQARIDARRYRLTNRLGPALATLDRIFCFDRLSRATLISRFRKPRFRGLAPPLRGELVEELVRLLDASVSGEAAADAIEAYLLVEWAEARVRSYLGGDPTAGSAAVAGFRIGDMLRDVDTGATAETRVALVGLWAETRRPHLDDLIRFWGSAVEGPGDLARFLDSPSLEGASESTRAFLICALARRVAEWEPSEPGAALASAALLRALASSADSPAWDDATRLLVVYSLAVVLALGGDADAARAEIEDAAKVARGSFPSPASRGFQPGEETGPADPTLVARCSGLWLTLAELDLDEFLDAADTLLDYVRRSSESLHGPDDGLGAAAFDRRVEQVHLEIARELADLAERTLPEGAEGDKLTLRLASVIERYHNALIERLARRRSTGLGAGSEADAGALLDRLRRARDFGGTDTEDGDSWMGPLTVVGTGEAESLGLDLDLEFGPAPEYVSGPLVPEKVSLDSADGPDRWVRSLGPFSSKGRPAVWIGMHVIDRRLRVYAVEVESESDGQVAQVRAFRPKDVASIDAGEMKSEATRFRKGLDQAWASFEKNGPSPQAIGILAKTIADHFQCWRHWTDKTIGTSLSTIWKDRWDGAHVILSASGPAWSVPADLLTIKTPTRSSPLYLRAGSIRWAMNLGLQRRMNETIRRDWESDDWVVGGHMPRTWADPADGSSVVYDPSNQGKGPEYLAKLARTAFGDRTAYLGRNQPESLTSSALGTLLDGGACSNLALLAHGFLGGGILLDDGPVHRLGGDRVRLRNLALISCLLGHLEDRSPMAGACSGLIARTLAGGAEIGGILAFRTIVGDCFAVNIALGILQTSLSGSNASGDLATARRRAFEHFFPAGQPWFSTEGDALDPARLLHQVVLASSIVFAGAPESR